MSPAARRLRLLLPLILLLACGRKGAIKPPEYAKPQAIEDLKAVNEADAVVLSWKRPERYADGTRMTDLGAFSIERAAAGEAAFRQVATLPVTDLQRFRQIKQFRFADRGVVEGQTHRYRVVSSTVDGYVSAPSNIVTIVREPGSAPTPAQKE